MLPAGRVRRKEAANIAKMNLIRGTNMALQFAVLPIAAFITFSVVRHATPHREQLYQGVKPWPWRLCLLPAVHHARRRPLTCVACGSCEVLHKFEQSSLLQVWAQGKTLQVSSVFYALALLQVPLCMNLKRITFASLCRAVHLSALWNAVGCLLHLELHRKFSESRCETMLLGVAQLPQLYMATFFTRGVETASELRISLRRLDAFLALPEPPPPSHLSAAGSAAQVGAMAGNLCWDCLPDAATCSINPLLTHEALGCYEVHVHPVSCLGQLLAPG